MIRTAPLTAAILLGLGAASAVSAEPTCYDVKVRAKPVDQIPSEIGDCGDGCIIMSWPWFVDLQVKHVMDGTLSGKMVRVLTVQHTYYVPREGTWLLRKNEAGGYNALVSGNEASLPRCSAGATPDRPYIRPAEGHTLEGLRDKGLRRYGHHIR